MNRRAYRKKIHPGGGAVSRLFFASSRGAARMPPQNYGWKTKFSSDMDAAATPTAGPGARPATQLVRLRSSRSAPRYRFPRRGSIFRPPYGLNLTHNSDDTDRVKKKPQRTRSFTQRTPRHPIHERTPRTLCGFSLVCGSSLAYGALSAAGPLARPIPRFGTGFSAGSAGSGAA
jgi:hypothetical protein